MARLSLVEMAAMCKIFVAACLVLPSAALLRGTGSHLAVDTQDLIKHLSGMRPEVVAHLLSEVERSWEHGRLMALRGEVDETTALQEMKKSCVMVSTAVVQGSSGDYAKVTEYMQDVCSQDKSNEEDKVMCQKFADGIGAFMKGDDVFNREDLHLEKFCESFYAGSVTTAAQELKVKLVEEEAAATKKAEELKTEQVAEAAKKAAEAKAAAEKKAEEEKKAAEKSGQEAKVAAQKKAEEKKIEATKKEEDAKKELEAKSKAEKQQAVEKAAEEKKEKAAKSKEEADLLKKEAAQKEKVTEEAAKKAAMKFQTAASKVLAEDKKAASEAVSSAKKAEAVKVRGDAVATKEVAKINEVDASVQKLVQQARQEVSTAADIDAKQAADKAAKLAAQAHATKEKLMAKKKSDVKVAVDQKKDEQEKEVVVADTKVSASLDKDADAKEAETVVAEKVEKKQAPPKVEKKQAAPKVEKKQVIPKK